MLGLSEIEALQRANPSPDVGGGIARPDVTRAIGRAEVVLLCSHLEQYVYALVEAAAEEVVAAGTVSDAIPEELRLLHSRDSIDDVASVEWTRRAAKLASVSQEIGPLWSPGAVAGRLDHERLLSWMKTPDPQSLVRAFRPWGVPDVFSAITRTPHNRSRIWLKIRELSEKRNNIAHGDFTTEATHLDVASYRRAVREFSQRADRVMSRRVRAITGQPALPW